jgi:glycosyltransferase involved in cell wall biosynthesis
VHGPALNDAEVAHRRELKGLVSALSLDGRVVLGDAVPRAEVPRLLARSDVLVNNMEAGAPDKVVYEACASCLPVLASNPVFDELLPAELRFPRGDAAELARRLASVGRLEPAVRADLGRELRERVLARHSVDSWADGILAVAAA